MKGDRHFAALIFFVVLLVMSLAKDMLRPFEQGHFAMGYVTALVSLILLILGALAICPQRRIGRMAIISAVSLFAAYAAMICWEVRSPANHGLISWLGEERQMAEVELKLVEGPIFHDGGISFSALLLDVDIDEEGLLTENPPRVRVFYPTRPSAGVDACSPLPLPGDQFRSWVRMERFTPAEVSWRRSHRQLMEGRGYAAGATILEPIAFVDGAELSGFEKVTRWLTVHRILLERRVGVHLHGDSFALATAMLTGSRGHLRPEFREPFDVTSTGHILAISGLHFAVIAGLIAFALRLLLDRFSRIYQRCPRRTLIGILTLIILVGYLLAIGAPVSARRAFGMTAIAIYVISFSPRRISPLSALATTAGILLLFRPPLVAELGFQLSVAATAGICLFLQFRPQALRRDISALEAGHRTSPWMRRFLLFCGISLAATTATFPILLKTTGELPLAGLWTNLLVVPLVSTLIFPVLVAGALLTAVFPWLAGLLLNLSMETLLLIHAGLDQAAYWPGSVYRWGTSTTWEVFCLFAAAAAAIVGAFRLRALLLAAAFVGLAILPGALLDATASPQVTIHFIPVGQGDATLIEFSDGTTILVDGGGRPVGTDPGLQQVVPYLRHRGISRLDAVVLTHGDYDHYGGLFAVIRPFSPGRFIFDGDEDNHNVLRLRDEMEAAGVEVVALGRNPAIIETSQASVYVRRPHLPWASDNDRSLVVTMTYAGAGVLLAGDLETAGEAWLVDNISGRRALLKVPHHGSNTSSSDEFLDHMQPAAAVVSAGRHNRFGHPHPDVVDRYESRNIDFFRLDHHGAVTATISDDGTLRIRRVRWGLSRVFPTRNRGRRRPWPGSIR